MEGNRLNKVEIIRKNGQTKIRINNQEVNFVGKYSIIQDMDIENGIPMLEIKMAIDEKNSSITI